MSKRILLTTTSFQDTPGKHHDVLVASGYEVVKARGPFNTDEDLLNAVFYGDEILKPLEAL